MRQKKPLRLKRPLFAYLLICNADLRVFQNSTIASQFLLQSFASIFCIRKIMLFLICIFCTVKYLRYCGNILKKSA